MTPHEAYAEKMEAAIAPFHRQLATLHTVVLLTASVRRAQADFLSEYPEYVAAANVKVFDDGHGNFCVAAPICTYQQKLEADELMRQVTASMDAMLAKAVADQARDDRRHKNMMRQHRRLMRRYGGQLPPSTTAIWSSLTDGQQYAILKDFDYEARHEFQRLPRSVLRAVGRLLRLLQQRYALWRGP